MKLSARNSLLSIMLVVLGLMLGGCGQGPQGVPPLTLEHARQLEATSPKQAVETYMAVRNEFDGKDNETSATALLRATQLASDPDRYVLPAQKATTNPQQLRELYIEGDTAARAAVKQLEQSYPATKAAELARNQDLLGHVERSLDDLNSHSTYYKVVDGLVKMTGSVPAFSYWFALVLIAIFIKVVTFPLLLKTYKSGREMQRVQPIIKKIQAEYKDNPQELQMKTMAAYKEHGVSPFASCLPSLIQMPVFFLMFALIRAYEIHFQHGHFLWINPAVANSAIGHRLGIAPDLAHLDMPILILYAASMYISMKLAPSPDPQMAQQQKTMSVMMTGMMIYWFMVTKWASAFLLYYLVQNIISTWQQYKYMYKPNKLNALNNPPEPLPPTNKYTPKASPGVHDVTFVETKKDDANGSRNGSAAPASKNNPPRPKRKTRR